MKRAILRAVSEPAQLFWAPMIPAGINMMLAALGGILWVQAVGGNPLIIFLLMVLSHGLIVTWGVKEPHLTTMMQPWMLSRRATTNFIKSKGRKFIP